MNWKRRFLCRRKACKASSNQQECGIRKSILFFAGANWTSNSDPCLYVRLKDGKYSYIMLYLDDTLMIIPSQEEYNSLLSYLKGPTRWRFFGDARLFLGIRVERTVKGFTLSQESYIKKLVSLEDAKPSRVQTADGSWLYTTEGEEQPTNIQEQIPKFSRWSAVCWESTVGRTSLFQHRFLEERWAVQQRKIGIRWSVHCDTWTRRPTWRYDWSAKLFHLDGSLNCMGSSEADMCSPFKHWRII